MNVVTLGADWTDVAADLSFTAGTDYAGQAQDSDIEYRETLTSEGTPDPTDRGFILYDEGTVQTYTHRDGYSLWMRRRPDGTTGFSATLIITEA